MKEKKRTISTLFFLIVGCVAIFTTFYLIADMKKKESSLQKMMASLSEEKESVEKQNNLLKEKISYLNTDESNEREAKENLNYKNEDEKVVIIRRPIKEVKATSDDEQVIEKTEKDPNFKVWWKHFFGKLD